MLLFKMLVTFAKKEGLNPVVTTLLINGRKAIELQEGGHLPV